MQVSLCPPPFRPSHIQLTLFPAEGKVGGLGFGVPGLHKFPEKAVAVAGYSVAAGPQTPGVGVAGLTVTVQERADVSGAGKVMGM